MSRKALAAALLTPLFLLSACTGTATQSGNSASSTNNQSQSSRTVTTSIGEVTVPADIDSVVVLEGRRDLDIVLSLGLPLTGYPNQEKSENGLESPLAKELEAAKKAGAEAIFLDDDINIEAIAAKEPDVIISREEDVKEILPELQEIAPVLVIGDQDSSTWQDDLNLVAKATGTEDKAKEVISRYDAAVAETKKKYAEKLSGNTFAPIGYDSEKVEIRSGRLLSLVLQDLGAQPSQAFSTAISSEKAEFSPEELLAAGKDATAIIMLVNDTAEWEGLQKNQLYQQLPAVSAGKVVRSDRQTHEGAGLTAIHCVGVIDQLLATL